MAGVDNSGDLASLIQSGQGNGGGGTTNIAGHAVEENEGDDSAEQKGKPKRKPTVPALAQPLQQAFVGSPCEKPGCRGTLKSVSTLDTPTHREQHLACAICMHKPKNNVLRTPRTVRRQS